MSKCLGAILLVVVFLVVSSSTYVPGKGLTMTYQGEVRGTIPGSTFMQMYYRYNVGEKAPKNISKGLLGL